MTCFNKGGHCFKIGGCRIEEIITSNNWSEGRYGDTVDLLKTLDNTIIKYDTDFCHRIGQLKSIKSRPVLIILL